MESEMVRTRQQAKIAENNMASQSMTDKTSAETYTDRTDSHFLHGVTIDVEESERNRPRESASWSIGDYPRQRNPFVTEIQTQDQGNSQAIKHMEARVSSMEQSLKSVTEDLKTTIRNFNAAPSNQNSNSFSQRETVQSRSNTYRTRNRQESSDESDSEYHDERLMSISSTNTQRTRRNNPKLPPFTGKETWKVWYNRFEDVSVRQRWSADEKLDELLPRLQGTAGEFVYGQLSQSTRSDYKSLCDELSSRFRIVETSKASWVQFTHRNQLNGETVEEYAAELKKLYDKARVHRDHETRKEDLLRRFLDGLIDDKARFHVEFIKDPSDIDNAVYHTVCFQETRQRSRKVEQNSMRSMKVSDIFDYNSDIEDEIVTARTAPGRNKDRIIKRAELDKSEQNEATDLEKLREIVRTELQAMTMKTPNNYYNTRNEMQRNNQNAYNNRNQEYNSKNQFYATGYQQRPKYDNYGEARPKSGCFNCGETTHYKRECPYLNQPQQLQQNKTTQNKKPDLN